MKFDYQNAIFVFGSNEAGYHGAGAAKFALMHKGAIMRKGIGHHGQSYALPTKDHQIRTLPIDKVKAYIHNFRCYAEIYPHLQFQVTCVGCGLAGFEHQQIAPLFFGSPDNCWFDTAWQPWLGETHQYWGHK
jgi:hypothetical protein